MTLIEYIEIYYSGNQSSFAASCDVKPQQVTQWINKGFIVVDHILYSPRRELTAPPENT
ncbi:hypothetical protein AAIC24_001811 [Providencia rettgeri]|nr:hypothetical protein [Providencia rettgeri]